MWKILSIFPPTYFTIKTTAGGHELERQGISVLPHFPIYCLVFFWATSFTSSTFRGLTCQALCYLYSFLAKKKAFPMRLNSQWTWASGSWINSWQTRNTLGLWHDVTFWTDLRKDLWELNSTGNAAPSSPSLCWEQMAKSLWWWPWGWTAFLFKLKMDFCSILSPLA